MLLLPKLSSPIFLTLQLIFPLLSSASFASLSSINIEEANEANNRFIVELKQSSDLPHRRRAYSAHGAFYESLRTRGIGFIQHSEWDHDDLFVGVEMTLDALTDLVDVLRAPGVVTIRPVRALHLPGPINQQVITGPGDPNLPIGRSTPQIMSGIDKVHAQGFRGEGINIAIIDSGIDYLHPSLGGGFGPSFLVKRGYDFVGDAYNGQNTPSPDADPIDTCNGHGTHVAGIIAAQPNNSLNVTGVAWKASLSAYRVLGCDPNGSASDPVIIDALLKAYDDGNDVINLSLGNPDGWTESTTGVVASRIAQKGRIVTVAAGNEGDRGAWYATGPGSGEHVIAVGSVDSLTIPYFNATLSNGHAPIAYIAISPLNIPGTRSIYATSTDTTNPAKGGRYFLIYNDGSAFTPLGFGPFQGALTRAEDGIYLVNEFASGSSIKITFQPPTTFGVPVNTGGLVSPFTNFGPTFDLELKPAVTAPGGYILSTLPRTLGTFGIQSGTSMSSPFVAGTAALVLQAKGKSRSVAKSMRSLLEVTSQPVPASAGDSSVYATAIQQGSGLVNAYNAINFKTEISKGEILLNDTVYGDRTHIITLDNNSNKLVTYKFSHSPAQTVLTVDPTSRFPYQLPLPVSTATAQVSFASTSAKVLPYIPGVLMVTIKPPIGLDPASSPVYSGFITIISSLGEQFSIPYMGVATAMRETKILDTTDDFFGVPLPTIINGAGEVITDPANYTFVGADVPILVYRRSAGSPGVYIDLVDKNVQVPTPPRKRGLPGLGWFWDFFNPRIGPGGGGSFAAVKTVGLLRSSQYVHRHITVDQADRGYEVLVFDGKLLNGTQVTNNKEYKLLIRAQKITGNPKKQEDFESWLSPIIGVARP